MKCSKLLTVSAVMLLSACNLLELNNEGKPVEYVDPKEVGNVGGVGIESNDIIAMTNKMYKSMRNIPAISESGKVPRVIVDAEYIVNESTSRVNKNLLGDRLRIQLNKAADGDMVFVARHLSNMVEKERELKRDRAVDAGTIRTTRAQAGADYRLGGRIMSQDALQKETQEVSRYHLVTFELIDLELGTVVWSDLYEFKKEAQDNIIYR